MTNGVSSWLEEQSATHMITCVTMVRFLLPMPRFPMTADAGRRQC
jgi:hypothetical protein